MAEEYLAKWVNRVWTSWQPGLQELSPRYDEPVFAALVAFCGLQNTLWPLWLRCCAEAGQSLSADEQVFYVADPELHQYPWVSIFNPMDTQSAWVLVRGTGLPDSREVFPELMHTDVVLTLQTMTEEGRPIMHGVAPDLFYRWGLLKGDNKVVFLPVVRCELLIEDWPLWRDSALAVWGIMAELAKERIALGRNGKELRGDFLELAGMLWSVMQQEKLIKCAPFKGGETLLRFFDLKKKPQHFNGILILLGDHQRLWQTYTSQR